MTLEEYNNSAKALRKRYEASQRKLAEEYALANNPYSVGSILSDHMHTIKVSKIATTIGYGTGEPTCVYSGIRLRKSDLKPTTKNEVIEVYQRNVIKVHE